MPPPAEASMSSTEVRLPDTGDAETVEVVELCAVVGDQLDEHQTVIVVETDKATLEVSAPGAGVLTELKVGVGDQIASGQIVALYAPGDIDASGDEPDKAPEHAAGAREASERASGREPSPKARVPIPRTDISPDMEVRRASVPQPQARVHSRPVYAGPAARKLARELGVDLGKVTPSGARGRTLKEDVKSYVRARLTTTDSASAWPALPKVDFAAHGPIREVALSRVRRASARNLHRSWVNVPQVTHIDEADATALVRTLEAARKPQADSDTKLTPLALIMHACIATLKTFPRVNASLNEAMTHWIYKEYWHVGFAVDTDDGLLVPVIRDADRKDAWTLAAEIALLADKARAGKLSLAEMQGGSFTISSLGRIGGVGFTPLVNGPQAAILGVSRLATKPYWNGDAFEPRQMLPLVLSYDHRAIDGAEAGRFMAHLCEEIAHMDLR